MAEEEKKDTEEVKGGGTPWLLIIAAVVISLGAGAGGAFVVLGGKSDPATDAEAIAQAAEVAAAKREAGGEAFKERLYSLDPFVVNVTGDGYSRFLKVKLELEAEEAGVKEELDARLSRVRDAMIVLLSSKQLSDITDFEGKALLKEDILERINDVLETGQIKSVMFTEFVVQ